MVQNQHNFIIYIVQYRGESSLRLENKKIAFGFTSSFYTYKKTLIEVKKIVAIGGIIYPVMSYDAYSTDTKFGKASEFIRKIEDITGKTIINSLQEAEEVEADIIVICPCSR